MALLLINLTPDNLPSFLWLWRIAAWSMGLSVTCYGLLAVLGLLWRSQRQSRQRSTSPWIRRLHFGLGVLLVLLVLGLLLIGLVGTLGHYGSLGHSWHLPAGLTVVGLTLISAWSASQIHPQRPWARPLHLRMNVALGVALILVSLSGWSVVQKYLP
ncbi:DUF4079 domain-containing protein [Lyngbya confervoides]|uniref:DUF4079 domain-containing protein n=1 Tax=Lyngbya confervoides BDU141951 TaxID=1574623 RepID=A0ABD4T5P6_9CYAN|nr:DUF4079 domain-containing protein [Lyngbya confervoides]MCM1983854.1 DUF4079 domain-containing protein [Lyngbya confervoides BDU141951]